VTAVGLLTRLNDLDDKVLPRKPWRGTKAEAIGLTTGGGAMAFGMSDRPVVGLAALAVSLSAFAFEMVQRRRQPSAA